MNSDAPTDRYNLNNVVKKLPRAIRGHIVAMLGELIGTTSFIFFAFAGTQTANIVSNSNSGDSRTTTVASDTPQQLLYISLSFGFSLAVNAWVFFRVSGGLFNPAVTLGMVLIGAITILRGVLLFIMQMAGAIAGAYMVDALFTGGLNTNTVLSATTTHAQGVIIEMLLTALLCFTIFMLAAEKHVGNFIAPVGIGLALFICEMVGVFWTGGSLNPARSFAPAVVTSFKSTQWVYWVGPICGSILAVIIFKVIKALEYETANPDPAAPAPTGPTPSIPLDPTDSQTLREDQDLERGPSKEYSDRDTPSLPTSIPMVPVTRQNVTAGRQSGPTSHHTNIPGFGGLGNSVPDPRYTSAEGRTVVAPTTTTRTTTTVTPPMTQTYPQIAPPTTQTYPQVNNTVPRDGPLNYGGERNEDVGRWNAVHTANARQNTHTLN